MLEWIKNNLELSIAIITIVIVLIVFLISFFWIKHSKNKNKNPSLSNEFINSVGGIDNIIQATYRESRLSLVINNYDLINEDELKKIGITSFIKMSNKITFIIGKQASNLCDEINSLKKK